MIGEDERDGKDIIDAAELLDGDGNVDPAAVASRRQNGVSLAVCEALRLDVANTDVSTQSIADMVLPQYSRYTISKHIRGECSHDTDVPPVERVCRWEPQPEESND